MRGYAQGISYTYIKISLLSSWSISKNLKFELKSHMNVLSKESWHTHSILRTSTQWLSLLHSTCRLARKFYIKLAIMCGDKARKENKMRSRNKDREKSRGLT